MSYLRTVGLLAVGVVLSLYMSLVLLFAGHLFFGILPLALVGLLMYIMWGVLTRKYPV